MDGGLYFNSAFAFFRSALPALTSGDPARVSGASLQPWLPRCALDRVVVLGYRDSYGRRALHRSVGAPRHPWPCAGCKDLGDGCVDSVYRPDGIADGNLYDAGGTPPGLVD